MPQPRVSIRLGTDGKAEVVKDFVDIGDAGDAQAKRISSAFQRDAAAAEAALEKLNKTAQKLASAGPSASGATNLVNPITGGSYAMADGRAQASARAIAEQMNASEAAARRLLASIDPLYAAQLRYDTALAEANSLQRQGALTSAQLATVQTGLKAELDTATQLYGKQGTAIGNTRIAQMELMRVVRGSVDQYAAGAPPMQIFTMHLGMLGQAAALSGDSMGKFAAFMAGPWGLALTVAVVALARLVTKLIETGDKTDDLVEKLRKEARQQVDNDKAHAAFAQTLAGVEESLRGVEKAYRDYEDRLKTSAQVELDMAKRALAIATARQAEAQATINATRAVIEHNRAMADAHPNEEEYAGFAALADAEEKRLDRAQTDLNGAAAAIARANRDIENFQSIVSVEHGAAGGLDRIKQKYEGSNGLIEQARRRALAEHQVGDELERQVRALKDQEAAEVKAYEAAHRNGPANAGGTAIFNDQIASFFDIANKYRGKSETSDKGVLEAFFRAANENLDPEKVKWCAAFVNAVLAAGGVQGTNSLAAKSFLTYGKDDTHSPQKGDVVVLRSGGGEHVGFLDTIDKAGNVRVLAGNTGNRVAEATYSKSQVLAIRRPPTPSEAATEADKAAAAAINAQQAFDEERSRLQEQQLAAIAKVTMGAEASAAAQVAIAQAEHDAEARKIETNLAEGKYGEATSQLAKTRAAELNAANDSALQAREAAINLTAYVKSLQALDASNERDTKYRVEGLQYAESIARSARERRDLELQIIDIQYDEKKKHLEYLLSLAKLAGKTEEAADLQDQINRLPADKARAQDQANRQNRSPWQDYLDHLPQTIDEVNEALQKTAVNGLEAFNRGLIDAALNGKSLKDVFHNVAMSILADLLKLAEQEALMALFGKSQQGQQGQGGGGGGIFGTLLSGLTSIAGALAGGGGGGGYSSTKTSDGDQAGFATGTEFAPGGLAWVGEHGKELVRMPRGSKVYTASESRRIAANDGYIGAIHMPTINIDATGADPAGLARVQAQLDHLEATLPAQVVMAVRDARERFVIRSSF